MGGAAVGAIQQEVASALRQAKIARHLSDAQRQELAYAVHCRDYPPGSLIPPSHELMLVIHGYVDVVLTSRAGRAVREGHHGPGSLLCTRLERDWGPTPAMCVGQKGAVIGALTSESLVAAAQRTPRALLEMLTWQDEDVTRQERFAAVKALYGLRAQIALHLVELALSNAGNVVHATHVELALDLGCSRSHVSEHLNDFRSRDLIEYGWHDAHHAIITVTDVEGLLREAGE